jgi:predicted ArsR family transcriptional regulator
VADSAPAPACRLWLTEASVYAVSGPIRSGGAALDEDAALRAVAALHDETRHEVYRCVRQARRAVTREEIAEAAGISRKLAAFHLEKLVEVGLLQDLSDRASRQRRLGRTPKAYAPTTQPVAVAIPPQHPTLLAEMLVEALDTARAEETAQQAALRVAARRGRELGAAARMRHRAGRARAAPALAAVEQVLRDRGFEPFRVDRSCVRLHNCPFQPMAVQAPQLVCTLNQRLIAGVLDGLQVANVHAALAPGAGGCCVELRGPRS